MTLDGTPVRFLARVLEQTAATLLLQLWASGQAEVKRKYSTALVSCWYMFVWLSFVGVEVEV